MDLKDLAETAMCGRSASHLCPYSLSRAVHEKVWDNDAWEMHAWETNVWQRYYIPAARFDHAASWHTMHSFREALALCEH